jgi:KUP system potassium uptake protein
MPTDGLGYEADPMTDSGPSSAVLPNLSAHGKQAAPSLGKLVAALGIVYGDIGTSPLYALKECVSGPHGVAPTPENVLGLLSLIFWSLTLVVVVKYLVFVLRADNNGEGGVLSLMALVSPTTGIVSPRRLRTTLAFLGLFGAALLYGDGMITPAISVLSAVEGIRVATPLLGPLVVPITCMLLVGLFLIQRRGTAGIGAFFGPAMVVWFASLAMCGLPAIFRRPDVLRALDPSRGVMFFVHNGLHGYLVLGAVVLCVTGGEALYADMGHFGRRAIRVAWYWFAMPALVINYFGQGAVLLENPANAENPLFALTPGVALYPMLAIATVAAIIASQALISGAFSITRQAMQMGYSPRMTIIHTSERERGQIYIPTINWMLMIACLWLVLAFRHSSGLAAAYGISVTGTMAITSLLFYAAARERWGWSKWKAGPLLALFLIVDLAFLGANLTKISAGGWVPLAVAAAVFAIMTTWRRGRLILGERLAATTLPLKLFLADVERTGPYRVPGTAVFMTSTRRGTPGVLLHHFKHNKVLHEKVVILTIVTDDVPSVEKRHRIHFREFGPSFWAVTAHYGFMQTPRISEILRLCRQLGLDVREEQCSFYLGRETLVPGRVRAMAGWRRRLFAFLSRNARPPTDFFGLPPNRVLELGMQIEL